MSDALPPEPVPPRRRRRILVLVVAIVLIAAAVVIGWLILRPWTIGQVFGLEHFQPGNQLTVAGTITAVHRENTSYGPRVALDLDSDSLCTGRGHVWGDPNATYHVGDALQTTLHFTTYTFNGDPAVSAPELACPFPGLFQAVGVVVDSVSEIAGISFSYQGTQAGGWRVYEIITHAGLAYNASVLPVTLRKETPIQGANPELPAGSTIDSAGLWTTAGYTEYLRVSGGYPDAPVVDRMTSLASATSANGTLSFADANHDGLVDDGDRLSVRLPGTESPSAWDTYLLQLGSALSQGPATYAAGVHYILNGPNGPFETLASSKPTLTEFRYVGDQAGPPIQTTVEVASVPFGSPPAIGQIEYTLTVNGSAGLSGTLASLPTSAGAGITLSFSDGNADGLLDAGDRFTVSGAANQTALSLQLVIGGTGAGSIDWIVGYGVPYHAVPDATFSVQGSGPWTITADVPSWSPELALNRTLRATLLENGLAVVTNASLASGTIGTFTGGTLTFSDADGDGFLSTGDSFTLNGDPTATYQVRISLLFTLWIAPINV